MRRGCFPCQAKGDGVLFLKRLIPQEELRGGDTAPGPYFAYVSKEIDDLGSSRQTGAGVVFYLVTRPGMRQSADRGERQCFFSVQPHALSKISWVTRRPHVHVA